MTENLLYYGDNLDVLRRHIRDESVDLVYLDPPFNSNANYNVLFAAKDGHQSAAQIHAFEDTWRWDESAARSFAETVEQGGAVADVLLAFERLVPASDMLAYLAMMAPRLVELRRVLKPAGSLYLHCDPTASHYLKLLLDGVFGPNQFLNEVIWKRTSAHNDPSKYGRIHDTILFYAKGNKHTWNRQFTPYSKEYIDAEFRPDATGRVVKYNDLTAPSHGRDSGRFCWRGVTPPASRMWSYKLEKLEELYAAGLIKTKADGTPIMRGLKTYLDDLPGIPLQSIWTDVDRIGNTSGERLGYPTQKPEALLERIIATSSNPGDVVLDPFCGCGTTVSAAQQLHRRWIGIDVTYLAIGLIKTRLRDAYGDTSQYRVIGEPTTVEDAEKLAEQEPYQFQAWALGLVGARPSGDVKKGADKGIDGRLLFHDGSEKTRQIVLSVKAGKLHANYIRDLRGVLEREKADIAVLLSFQTPTKLMRQEAALAGFYTSPWGKHARLQLLTVADLLDGKGIDYPRTAGINRTYKQAPKALKKVAEPKGLFDSDDS